MENLLRPKEFWCFIEEGGYVEPHLTEKAFLMHKRRRWMILSSKLIRTILINPLHGETHVYSGATTIESAVTGWRSKDRGLRRSRHFIGPTTKVKPQ